MAEIDLQVAFNRLQRITFVRGEDRQYNLLLKDDAEGLPIDLTGAKLTVAFPADGGGFIKRRTGGLAINWATAQTLNGLSVIKSVSHGLVTGDAVTLDSTAPAPFDPTETYFVVVQTQDTFGLIDGAGNYVAIAAPSQQTTILSSTDFTLGNVAIGQASLTVSAHVTAAAAIGQGLNYQLTYVNAEGHTRIYATDNQLDVFAAPCP